MFAVKDLPFGRTPLIMMNVIFRTYSFRDLQLKFRETDGCKENHILWTRTLDRNTRVGLTESVVSRMSGTLTETTQDRKQMNDTNPVPDRD